MLIVELDKLTLRDIYEAVEGQSVFSMHDPHPDCPVAYRVNQQVHQLVDAAETNRLQQLGRTKLSTITKPAMVQYKAMSS